MENHRSFIAVNLSSDSTAAEKLNDRIISFYININAKEEKSLLKLLPVSALNYNGSYLFIVDTEDDLVGNERWFQARSTNNDIVLVLSGNAGYIKAEKITKKGE